MADQRSYTGGNFRLEVGKSDAGYLRKVSGGGMKADIAEHKLGPQNYTKKNVAKIAWEEVKFEVGIGMGDEVYKWIKAAFDKNFLTQQCTLVAGDFNHKAVQEMQYIDCLVSSVATPKFDGSDKNPAYFTVAFRPERVRHAPGDGTDIRAKMGPAQKAHLCSNFRLSIPDMPCNRVASIDAMELKCSVSEDAVGIYRENSLHPMALTVPDMKVTWSYADFTAIEKKAYDWFVLGHHLEGQEWTTTIELLDPNMKDKVGEITLLNCGWKEFKSDDREGGSDKILRCTGTFYVEQMQIQIDRYDSAS
ncbi:MAG TPA: phage tail protein [Kofleriaceae bacterium]|jgi:hypothetical protein|nr:phage tail protein [Kofleriaceae bacterium]